MPPSLTSIRPLNNKINKKAIQKTYFINDNGPRKIMAVSMLYTKKSRLKLIKMCLSL